MVSYRWKNSIQEDREKITFKRGEKEVGRDKQNSPEELKIQSVKAFYWLNCDGLIS